MPAQAIIAALSLHKFNGGKTETKFSSPDNFVKFSLIDKLEATPPAITKLYDFFFYFLKILSLLLLFFDIIFH